MDFLKPLGKGSDIQPQACMCSTMDAHAGAKQSSWIPPCLHCGCSCGGSGEYKTGNRVAALRSIGAK